MRTGLLHNAGPLPGFVQLPGLPALPAALAPVGAALRDLVAALRRWPRGEPYASILPKTFTGQITLSGTTGEVTRFAPQNFQNSGKFPFVLEYIATYDLSSASAWRLEIFDKDTGYRLLGDQPGATVTRAPAAGLAGGRLPWGAWAPPIYRETRLWQPVNGPVESGGYEVKPTGGFGVLAESVGTATVAQVILAGYWILNG